MPIKLLWKVTRSLCKLWTFQEKMEQNIKFLLNIINNSSFFVKEKICTNYFIEFKTCKTAIISQCSKYIYEKCLTFICLI